MSDEFGAMSTWTAEAVDLLGDDVAVPAACRGSGGPGALGWLLDRMAVRPGQVLLDVGAGTGGAAEVAAARGLHPVLCDPEPEACAASRHLFGRPVVVADGVRLPLRDASVASAWSLGVLCTVTDQPALLREVARVVRPGGSVGLLVYVRTVDALEHVPEGNDFPTVGRLATLLRAADLLVRDDAYVDDVPPPGDAWSRAERRVDATVEALHGRDPVWRSARQQEDLVGELLRAGRVRGLLVACRRA